MRLTQLSSVLMMVLVAMLCIVFTSAQQQPIISFTTADDSRFTLPSSTQTNPDVLNVSEQIKQLMFTLPTVQPSSSSFKLQFNCGKWSNRADTSHPVVDDIIIPATQDSVSYQIQLPDCYSLNAISLTPLTGPQNVFYYQDLYMYSDCFTDISTTPTSTCSHNEICTTSGTCIDSTDLTPSLTITTNNGGIGETDSSKELDQVAFISLSNTVSASISFDPTIIPLIGGDVDDTPWGTIKLSWFLSPEITTATHEDTMASGGVVTFPIPTQITTPGHYVLRITWTNLLGFNLSSNEKYSDLSITILPSCFDDVLPLESLPVYSCETDKFCRLNNECLECQPGQYKDNDPDVNACSPLQYPSITASYSGTSLEPLELDYVAGGTVIDFSFGSLIGSIGGTQDNVITITIEVISNIPSSQQILSETITYDRNTGSTKSITLPTFGTGQGQLDLISTFTINIVASSSESLTQTEKTIFNLAVIPSCMVDFSTSNCGDNASCNITEEKCECFQGYVQEGSSDACVLPSIKPTITTTYTNHQITEPTSLPNDSIDTTALYTGSIVNVKVTQAEIDESKNRLVGGTVKITLDTDSFVPITQPLPDTPTSLDIPVTIPADLGNKAVIVTVTITAPDNEYTTITQTYKLSAYSHCYALDTESTQWVDTCGANGTCTPTTNECDCDEGYFENDNTCIDIALPTISVSHGTDLTSVTSATNNILSDTSIIITIASGAVDVKITAAIPNASGGKLFEITSLATGTGPQTITFTSENTQNNIDTHTLTISMEILTSGYDITLDDIVYQYKIWPDCYSIETTPTSTCDTNAQCAKNHICKCNTGYANVDAGNPDSECIALTAPVITAVNVITQTESTTLSTTDTNNLNVNSIIRLSTSDPDDTSTDATFVWTLNDDDDAVIESGNFSATSPSFITKKDFTLPSSVSTNPTTYTLTIKTTAPNALVPSPSDIVYNIAVWSKCYGAPSNDGEGDGDDAGTAVVWVDTCGANGTCNITTNECDCADTYVHDANGQCVELTTPSVVVTYKSKDGTDTNGNEVIDPEEQTVITLTSGADSSNDAIARTILSFVFTPDTVNPTNTNISVVLQIDAGEDGDDDDEIVAFQFDLSADAEEPVTKTYTLPFGREAYQMNIIYTLHDTTSTTVYKLDVYPACWTLNDENEWAVNCPDVNSSCVEAVNTCQCNVGYAYGTGDDKAKCVEAKYPTVTINYIGSDGSDAVIPLSDGDGTITSTSVYVGTLFTIKFTPIEGVSLPSNAAITLTDGDEVITKQINTDTTVVSTTVQLPTQNALGTWYISIVMTALDSSSGAQQQTIRSNNIETFAQCLDVDFVTDLCMNGGQCITEQNKCECIGTWTGTLCNQDQLVPVSIYSTDVSGFIRFKRDFEDGATLPKQLIMNTQTNVIITFEPLPSSPASTVVIELFYTPDLDGTLNPGIVSILKQTITTNKVPVPVNIVLPDIDTDKAFFRIVVTPNEGTIAPDISESLQFTILPRCYRKPVINLTTREQWVTICENGSTCTLTGECACPQGFTGDACDIEIDNNPCQQCMQENLSSCDDSKKMTVSTTPCICLSGWGGPLCADRTECITKSMQDCGYNDNDGMRGVYETTNGGGNGNCASQCTCLNEWTGKKCETCNLKCNNNGYAWKWCDKCGCAPGYAGESCDCQSVLMYVTLEGANAIIETTKGLYSGENNSFNPLSQTDIALKSIYTQIYSHFASQFDVLHTDLTITATPTTSTTTTIQIVLMYNCPDSLVANQWSFDLLQAAWANSVGPSIFTAFKDIFDISPDATTIGSYTTELGPSSLPPEDERLYNNAIIYGFNGVMIASILIASIFLI